MSRKFGVEIEAKGLTLTEVRELLNSNGIPCDSNDTRFLAERNRVVGTWKVVLDGSVTGGFELVSPPMQGEAALLEIKKVCELLNDSGAAVDRTCGLHVHVEATDLTAQQIANCYNRYLENEQEFDKLMPASRRGNTSTYCQSLGREGRLTAQATVQETIAQRRDRYRKVNLCSYVKYGTIEFRHHGGSVNGSKITKWIELLLIFVEASKECEVEAASTFSEVPVPAVYRTEAIAPQIYCTGKQRQIYLALQNGPATAQSLANTFNTTVASVQSMVCRLRRDGAPITTRRGQYYLNAQTRQVLVTPATTRIVPHASRVTLKPMWHNVPTTLKQFFVRRARNLGSQLAA